MKFFASLSMLMILCGGAFAQSPSAFEPNILHPSRWSLDALRAGKIVTLRQSSQDANSNTKPALIQWTSNNEAADSFAVDAAVQASVGYRDFNFGQNTGVIVFSPLAEYHRSTVTNRAVDTTAAGLSVDWVGTYNPVRTTNPNEVPVAATDHLAKLAIVYKNDRRSKGQGVQGALSYGARTALLGSEAVHGKRKETPYLDPQTNQIDESRLQRALLPWEWVPYVGIQAEQADGLQDEGGDIYRGKLSASLAAYPFSTVVSYPIALTIDYAGWWNFAKSGVFDDYSRYQKQFVAGIQWTLLQGLDRNAGGQYSVSSDGNSVVSIALQYYAGSNPEEGKPSQSYTQLTLRLRL